MVKYISKTLTFAGPRLNWRCRQNRVEYGKRSICSVCIQERLVIVEQDIYSFYEWTVAISAITFTAMTEKTTGNKIERESKQKDEQQPD